jgi:hypothetical protein
MAKHDRRAEAIWQRRHERNEGFLALGAVEHRRRSARLVVLRLNRTSIARLLE